MATSQNGLSANDRSLIASFVIPGSTRKIALRKGPVSVVLLDWLGFWHNELEPLDTGQLDDWGYAERTIRGSATELSNHASGSAGDANALLHPLGVDPRKTLGDAKLARMRARLPLYEGVVRSGAFYTGRKDGMHGEIDKLAKLAELAARINTGWLAPGVRSYMTGAPVVVKPVPAAPAPSSAPSRAPRIPAFIAPGHPTDPGTVGWVKLAQSCLAEAGLYSGAVDGVMSPGRGTERAVRALQGRKGLTVDGRIGPQTWCRGLALSREAIVDVGSKGAAVEVVQNIAGVRLDREFGPMTRDALKEVQRFEGLTGGDVDGRYGPETARRVAS